MRIGGELVIAGAAVWLPETTETTAAAVAAGRLDPEDADELGYRELPVSDRLAGPQLAVRAANEALRAAGTDPGELSLLVHAFSYYQGHDFFSPAHLVAESLGARTAIPVGVQQMCNGGAAGAQFAAATLLADPAPGAALVTTGDRFCEPGFDRWRGDYGVAYGDGGTALVLRRAGDDPAGLAVLAVTSAAAPEFEGMHRAGEPFAPAARFTSATVDTRRSKKNFLSAGGADFASAERDRVRAVLGSALTEAGVAAADLRCVVLPRLAGRVLADTYLPLIAAITPAKPVDLGRHTGHLGAGDLIAGVAALMGPDLLGPGECGAVLSAGAGFTWSCLIAQEMSWRSTRV
jgi:3-oxoacyl-[acyl-carrier-protein] synthase-3